MIHRSLTAVFTVEFHSTIMTTKIYRVSNNFLFQYRYKCPVDKRWTYFNKNDSLCFGACARFMGIIDAVIPARANFNTMTITKI